MRCLNQGGEDVDFEARLDGVRTLVENFVRFRLSDNPDREAFRGWILENGCCVPAAMRHKSRNQGLRYAPPVFLTDAIKLQIPSDQVYNKKEPHLFR